MIDKLFNRWIPLLVGGPRPQYLAATNPTTNLPLIKGGIEQINYWVYRNVAYKPDNIDEWSPAEVTLQRRYGDCEDLALLKRALLLAQGYKEDDVIMLIVYDLISRQDHALLLVNSSNRWYILDSRTPTVLRQEQVQDYTPIKGYTRHQTWIFGNERK
jgi:predicted transglutaminase-like cysteine proteinase